MISSAIQDSFKMRELATVLPKLPGMQNEGHIMEENTPQHKPEINVQTEYDKQMSSSVYSESSDDSLGLKAEIERYCSSEKLHGYRSSHSLSIEMPKRNLLVKQSRSANTVEDFLGVPDLQHDRRMVSASHSENDIAAGPSRLTCGLNLSPRLHRRPQRQSAINSSSLLYEKRRKFSFSPPISPCNSPPRSPSTLARRQRSMSRLPSDPVQPSQGSITDLSVFRLSLDSEDSFPEEVDQISGDLGAYNRPRSTTCPESRAWKVRQKRRMAQRPPTPPPMFESTA